MKRVTRPTMEGGLNEVLRSLRTNSTVFCRSDMGAPWGFAVKAHGRAAFHIILEGSCLLDVDGVADPMRLTSGDVVILPHGPEHRLRSDPAAPVAWLDDILAREPILAGRLTYGGNGAATELICGVFDIENREAVPIWSALPSIAHVRIDGNEKPVWLSAILELVEEESSAFAPGSASVVARVTEVLLLQVLRRALDAESETQRIYDPRIAVALRLIRERPAADWTVSKLAAAATSSRSAFVERFRQATGMPPMRYLSRVRLAKAATELRNGNVALAELADRVGYGSEAALSKAFQREFGVRPRDYRSAATNEASGPRRRRQDVRSAVPA
jgi:AraC-like DNA-binding protein/mannose-6-phosphate isomerase-like protein (cupin superfamily)